MSNVELVVLFDFVSGAHAGDRGMRRLTFGSWEGACNWARWISADPTHPWVVFEVFNPQTQQSYDVQYF